MIKTTSALLIVALGQFNYLYKNKEILPQKTGQIILDKPHNLPDSKGAKRQSKLLMVQEKSLKKTPQTHFLAAQNLWPALAETSHSTLNNFVEFTVATKTQTTAACCCMMMSA